MYISDEGKMYLINTNMDVIFTGAKTNNKECFNSLLDGELISHDKKGKFINSFAAFRLCDHCGSVAWLIVFRQMFLSIKPKNG